MNYFRKGQVSFLVPMKCGFTAFRNGAIQTSGVETDVVCAVARSPVNRVRSFFVDKLRNNVNPDKVQECQRLIMDYFGFPEVGQLRGVTMPMFVGYLALSDAATWDGHLQPFSDEFRKHEVSYLVDLDNPVHSRWLFSLLAIEPTEHGRYNKTGGGIEIDARSEDKLREIYRKDYDYMGKFGSELPQKV